MKLLTLVARRRFNYMDMVGIGSAGILYSEGRYSLAFIAIWVMFTLSLYCEHKLGEVK